MNEFNVALVGAGGIAKAHVAAAKASGGRVKIVAVADPSEPARRAIADATGAVAFASFDALLADGNVGKSIGGVIVCTPPSARLDIISAALSRKIAVLAEKPLAHNLDDAKKLAELATRHADVPTAVAYCHRFVPAVLEMKRRSQSGALGKLVRVENAFAGWNPGMQHKWMSEVATSGGGSFIDTGCHSLDLFRFLVGDAHVVGAVFKFDWPGRGESHATVLLRGERDTAAGVIESGWLEPSRFTLSLIGTDGTLSYDYEHPAELIFRPSQGSVESRLVESHEIRFERQLINFSELAQRRSNSRDRKGLATFEDGLKVAQLVDEAYRISII